MESRNSFLAQTLRFTFKAGIAVGLLSMSIILFDNPLAYAAEEESVEWFESIHSGVSERIDSLPFEVSGRYRVDYLGRFNGTDEDDHQLFQYLKIKVDDIVPGKVSLRFSGRLSAELDGNDDEGDYFADIYDSFNHSANGRVYYLYLDVKDPLVNDSNLKLGRINSYEPQSLLFNGAKYEQQIHKTRFYLQGGLQGTNYTGSDDDDTIGGLGVDQQVLPRTHVGYDYLRVEDENFDDDYHSFDVLQRFGSLKTYARGSVLNGDMDDLNLYGSYYDAPRDMNLTARYYSLLTQRDNNTNEFAPLVDVDPFDIDDNDTLGVYFPFHLVNLTAYKGHKDVLGVSAGFETRWMDDDDERNDLNREYDRYFLSVEAWDLIMQGLTTSVTVEFWDVDASEDSLSLGIDAKKDLTDKLNAQVGFYLSQYRIRTSFGGTDFSEDITTPELYGSLKYKWTDSIKLGAKYQIEDESDLGTTHELYLSCSIEF